MTKEEFTNLDLARKLLKTVRHAAYATVNEDGSPHNSPLMFMYDRDLTKMYIGSYSESRHVKNLERTGQVFVTLYDSFAKGQGGVYITGVNAHECGGDELTEALRVHNGFRSKYGSQIIDIAYYQADKPSQRMYSIDVAKIEIYTALREAGGLLISESRVEVMPADLTRDFPA